MKAKYLYPHLSDEYIAQNAAIPSYDPSTVTEADKALMKQINDEANIMLPVNPITGFRCTDIDTINTTKNPVILNVVSSRMKSLGTSPTLDPSLSNEEQAATRIKRGMTQSDLQRQLADSKQEIDFAQYMQQQSQEQTEETPF